MLLSVVVLIFWVWNMCDKLVNLIIVFIFKIVVVVFY